MPSFGFPGIGGRGEDAGNRIAPPNQFVPPHRQQQQQQPVTDQQLEEMFGNNGERFKNSYVGPSTDI
eukprot:gene26312-32877_t